MYSCTSDAVKKVKDINERVTWNSLTAKQSTGWKRSATSNTRSRAEWTLCGKDLTNREIPAMVRNFRI
jgi:hypothetical protein